MGDDEGLAYPASDSSDSEGAQEPIIVEYGSEGDFEEDEGGQLVRGGDPLPAGLRDSDSGMEDSENTRLEYHVVHKLHCFHQTGDMLPKTAGTDVKPSLTLSLHLFATCSSLLRDFGRTWLGSSQ